MWTRAQVEYRQFGPGRLGWSVWSSVAACAILVQNPMGASNFSCTRDLADIDCEKRRGNARNDDSTDCFAD